MLSDGNIIVQVPVMGGGNSSYVIPFKKKNVFEVGKKKQKLLFVYICTHIIP